MAGGRDTHDNPNSSMIEELRAVMDTVTAQYNTIIANQSSAEKKLTELQAILMGHELDRSVGLILRQKVLEEFMAKQLERNLVQDTTLRNVRWLWGVLIAQTAVIMALGTYIVKHFLNNNTH